MQDRGYGLPRRAPSRSLVNKAFPVTVLATNPRKQATTVIPTCAPIGAAPFNPTSAALRSVWLGSRCWLLVGT
jgi:hypothetical protein